MSKKNILIAFFIFILTMTGCWLMLKNPQIGKPATDFTLPTTQGSQFHLAESIQGKKSIIFFWATWCPHCRKGLINLSEKSEELANKGIELVVINVGESPDKIAGFIEKQNIPFDIVLDETEEIAVEYGIVGIPSYFYINAEGIVTDILHEIPENYEESFR